MINFRKLAGAMSPTHQESGSLDLFSFTKAIERVIAGDRVSKVEWNDKEFYCLLKDGLLMLHKPDGKFYQWTLNDGDLYGVDWFVIKD